MNYTRRSERHALALLKRSYQAAYYYVFHITVFLGGFLEGVWRRGCRLQCAMFGLWVCE
jgi:hypothetical protein